jgi:hypothetical protein
VHVFPLLYAGSISYYEALFKEQSVVFDLHERYVKQTLRNRIYILSANGVQPLSIPVVRTKGSRSSSLDVFCDDSTAWRLQHVKSLQAAYASSPYFEHYEQEVRAILLDTQLTRLMDFNLAFHQVICSWLGLDFRTEFTLQEAYSAEVEEYKAKYSLRNSEYEGQKYTQVFSQNGSFESDLSILDAIFNLGPMARTLLY